MILASVTLGTGTVTVPTVSNVSSYSSISGSDVSRVGECAFDVVRWGGGAAGENGVVSVVNDGLCFLDDVRAGVWARYHFFFLRVDVD
jgi:hypothetical protein